MLRGLYSAATGMITQYKKIDVLGNNISNVNTDGFKGDTVTLKSFTEEITSRMTGDVPVGSISDGVTVGAVSTDYTQGTLEQTGRNTDLYISGDGFFPVEATPSGGGVKYTRDGNFSVDTNGYLELASGERLLGSNGAPIYVGGTNFAVESDGTVTSGTTQLGKIQLYASQNANGTAKRNDGFFDITAPTQANGKLVQGSLEGSNVDAISEMTGMMQATRNFQSCQQVFQTNEETLDRLINQVGSLKA